MCLAIPGVIKKITDDDKNGKFAVIDYGGLEKRAELMLTPDASVGDAVIVHAGFVIAVLNKEAGEELIAIAKETGQYE